jgi:protein-tyrosine phosphatase
MRYHLCLFAAALAWADVSDATVEPAGADRYHVSFHMERGDAPISIFASHSPDRMEDGRPLAVTQTSPADVEARGWTGPVYFRLKTTQGRIRIASVRRLPLEGQDNFRDLGGYRTMDGRYIRWGRLYRSGQLSGLTERDYEYLKPLGIRLVCDVRSNEERTRQATRWPGDGPEFLLTPISGDQKGQNARLQELATLLKTRAPEGQMREFVSRLYPEMALTAAPQFQQIFTRLLSAEGASVVHCSAGKDRTGVYSALLLVMLGVPRQTVIEDYMLTNRYALADGKIAHTAVTYQKLLGLQEAPPIEVLRPVMAVERSYIESTLDSITKRYGSFDEYRRQALHLSDTDVERLRAKYLEP